MASQQAEFDTTRKLMEDITRLGVVDRTFNFPGREKTHKIRVGTLWENDVIVVKERAASRSSEPLVQQEIIVLETLVEAILEVDGFPFHSPIQDIQAQKKGQLRELLEQASPITITRLYRRYTEILQEGAEEIEARIEEIKKSSGPSEQDKPAPSTLE